MYIVINISISPCSRSNYSWFNRLWIAVFDPGIAVMTKNNFHHLLGVAVLCVWGLLCVSVCKLPVCPGHTHWPVLNDLYNRDNLFSSPCRLAVIVQSHASITYGHLGTHWFWHRKSNKSDHQKAPEAFLKGFIFMLCLGSWGLLTSDNAQDTLWVCVTNAILCAVSWFPR